MSYERLMELTESPAYVVVNWREIINEIDVELANNNSIERREALLGMFKATMDIAEKNIAPQDLETFREARRQHYSSHLIGEALVGGNVCAKTMFDVTSREIAAGRITEDDDLRKIAVAAYTAPHLTRAQLEEMAREPKVAEKKGLIGQLKGFFGR